MEGIPDVLDISLELAPYLDLIGWYKSVSQSLEVIGGHWRSLGVIGWMGLDEMVIIGYR